MSTKVHLDKAGRVSLPKHLRQSLKLVAGDSFEVQCFGDQITLRPVRHTAPIRKEQGVWVYRSGQSVQASIRQLIEEGRDERHEALLGLRK
jgi:AbrB family looped-hinge helix DNA binding protein